MFYLEKHKLRPQVLKFQDTFKKVSCNSHAVRCTLGVNFLALKKMKHDKIARNKTDSSAL